MKNEFYQKGVDLKLLLILYAGRIWISVLWTIVGALLFGCAYYMANVLYPPAREFEAVSKLYLTFDREDDGDAYQYYNGYTWNDLMGTEPIMDKILEELAGAEWTEDGSRAFGESLETEVRRAIKADILSDIRLLTVTVRTGDAVRTRDIIRACESALLRFGEEMVEFENIRVIDHGEPMLVVYDDLTVRLVAAGAVIGLVLSFLYIAVRLVMEDRIYVPSDVERYLGIPVLGVVYKKNPTGDAERLASNLSALGVDSFQYVMVGVNRNIKVPTKIKDTGFPAVEGIVGVGTVEKDRDVVLAVPYGVATVRRLQRDVADILLRGCRIKGAIISGADDGLYRLYFY